MIVNSHENFGLDIGYAKIIRILDTGVSKLFLIIGQSSQGQSDMWQCPVKGYSLLDQMTSRNLSTSSQQSIMHDLGEICTLKRKLMGFFFQKHLMICSL
jgi:hypothetical protein